MTQPSPVIQARLKEINDADGLPLSKEGASELFKVALF